jgi:hypothetical protein
MKQEPPLQIWSDRLLPRYVYYQKPFTVTFPEKCEWQNGFNADNKWGLVWSGTQMAPRLKETLVLGCKNEAFEGDTAAV